MASHKVAGFLPCFKLGEDHILTITGRHFKAPLVVAIEDSQNAYTWTVDQASVKILSHKKLTVKAKPTVVLGGRVARALVGCLVIGGGAAGFAVHKAVLADPDVELRLAKAAELIALAVVFRHFALGATEFGMAGSGVHSCNLALRRRIGNVPLVTAMRSGGFAVPLPYNSGQ